MARVHPEPEGAWAPQIQRDAPVATHVRDEKGLLPCSKCCVAVPQDRYIAVEFWGQFKRVLGPGLGFAAWDCFGACVALKSISARVEQIIVAIESTTKDGVGVHLRVAVQMKVLPDGIELAMYKLSDVGAQLRSYILDVVSSKISRMTVDQVFESTEDLAISVEEQLRRQMALFGYDIVRALILDIELDGKVISAMNEFSKQLRLKEATTIASEASLIQTVAIAEADADAACLQGEGIARARRVIVDGMQDAMHVSEQHLTSQRITELFLLTEWMDTMKQVGEMGSVVFTVGEQRTSWARPQRARHGFSSVPKQASMASQDLTDDKECQG